VSPTNTERYRAQGSAVAEAEGETEFSGCATGAALEQEDKKSTVTSTSGRACFDRWTVFPLRG
jgi:hypothetical protein